MEHARDEAIHRLRVGMVKCGVIGYFQRFLFVYTRPLLQEKEMRNSELERRIQNSEQNLNSSLEERDRMDAEIQRAIEILDIKIFDLNDLRQSLFKLINK